MDAGAMYNLWGASPAAVREEGGPLLARFVCDWSLPEAEIARFVEIARG